MTSSSSARQRSAPHSQPDEEGLDGAEGEADDEIINDIARVLKGSGANATPAAPASASPVMEEEEDILDLTAELGGLELVEDVEEIEDIEMVEVVAEAAPDIYQPAPARPQPAVVSPVVASPEPEPELELLDEIVLEAPEAEASAPEPAPEPKAPAAAQAPAEPQRMSASEEAASALERAIAALRAGQVPTSSSPFSSFQSRPEPSPAAEPIAPAQVAPSYEPLPMPPPIAAAPSYEPMPVPEPTLRAQPAPEFEPELVLAELEVEMIETEPVVAVEAPVGEPRMDQAWGMSATPSWAMQPQPELEIEEESEPPRVNGGSHQSYAAAGGSKSLEDSVKDMLRPMLKQWLDENMARVLTSALQDELKNNPSRLQGN